MESKLRNSFLTPGQFRPRSRTTSRWRSHPPIAHQNFLKTGRYSSHQSLFDSSFRIKESNSEEEEEGTDCEQDYGGYESLESHLGLRQSLDRHSFTFSYFEKTQEFTIPRIELTRPTRKPEMEAILDVLRDNETPVSEKARKLHLFCDEMNETWEDGTPVKPRSYTNTSMCDLSMYNDRAFIQETKSPEPVKKISFEGQLDVPPSPGLLNKLTGLIPAHPAQSDPKMAQSPTNQPEKRKSIFQKLSRASVFVTNNENSNSDLNNRNSTSSLGLEIPSNPNSTPKKRKIKKKNSSAANTRQSKSTLIESYAETSSMISEEDRLSMPRQSEQLEDPTLKVLSLSLFRCSMDQKECTYWDSLYIMISLCKMRELKACINLIIETDTFEHMRLLLESYNESLPIKAKFRLTDLVKSCISFFNYILFSCRMHDYSQIYTVNSVLEIAEELMNENIYRNIRDAIEDKNQLATLASLRESLLKEISSHAPLLENMPEATKISVSFCHTDLDDCSLFIPIS